MTTARVPRFGTLARRGGVAARRAGDRVGDVGAAVIRAGRETLGTLTLPERVWRAADVRVGAGVDDVLPLPAARALTRALTGARTPSLDAYAPLGPRPAHAPAALLMPVGGLAAGAWTPDAAASQAAARCAALRSSADAPARHTVLLTDRSSHAALLTALRRPRAGRLSGLLVAVSPDPGTPDGRARTLAALGLVDGVLAPAPAALDPALTRLAARAGRAVVGPEGAEVRGDLLAAAGRAARLAALTGPQAAGPTAEARPRGRVTAEPRRVVVAGHDLKFAGALMERLRAEGHEVRVDAWGGHARHDVERSRALAAWADVVHCEWSLGNLAWYSRHLDSPGRATRVTSRLHLQEAATAFPGRVRHDALDAWVFVAEHVRAQVLRDTRFPAARTAGDDARRFVLGLVGVLPERKGLHRALDLLGALRREEPRFTLRIRGHRPDAVGWMAARPAAADHYREQLRRIDADPLLAGAVTWDPHGPDMGAWYARVGVALSVSDFESFHFTLPDGAVHGCLPASLAWAGSDLLYPAAWLSPDVASLAEGIHAATRDPGAWRAATAEARDVVVSTYAEERVIPRLARRVLGVTAP